MRKNIPGPPVWWHPLSPWITCVPGFISYLNVPENIWEKNLFAYINIYQLLQVSTSTVLEPCWCISTWNQLIYYCGVGLGNTLSYNSLILLNIQCNRNSNNSLFFSRRICINSSSNICYSTKIMKLDKVVLLHIWVINPMINFFLWCWSASVRVPFFYHYDREGWNTLSFAKISVTFSHNITLP